MAAVPASLVFWSAQFLAILCALGAPMLLIKFQLKSVFRADVQNMNSQHFPHINIRAHKIHGEANLTLPYKGQTLT